MPDQSTAGLPAGAVIITTTEMYRELRTVAEKVTHLADLVDPALTNLRTEIAGVKSDAESAARAIALVQTDHETRMRVLERRMWIAAGIAAASGAGVGAVISQVLEAVR